MDKHQGVCISTVLPHWEMSDQSTARTSSTASLDCTTMANTTVVSGVVFNGHQETDPDTGMSGPAHKSPRGQSSLDRSGVIESSRMASIRKSLSAEGISEAASRLILASWRENTERSYSSCWKRWEKWSAKHGHEVICAPLSAILEFLTSEFLQGKEYRTINSYRSAISMTHSPIDGCGGWKTSAGQQIVKRDLQLETTSA